MKNVETAKERLKNSLSKLEAAVEKRVETVAGAGENDGRKKEALEQEITHLREENMALQAFAGKEGEKAKRLRHVNEQVTKRLGKLIGDVESIVTRQEV